MAEEERKCPWCGENVADDANSCLHCGAIIIIATQADENQGLICLDCGTKHQTGDRCLRCGAPLERCN